MLQKPTSTNTTTTSSNLNKECISDLSLTSANQTAGIARMATELQVCKDSVVANVEVDLPDCSHASTECNDAIENDNRIIDCP